MIRNAIRCKKCLDVIESVHVHDMRWCSCGQVAIDGGLEYGLRIWKNPDGPAAAYDDLSEDSPPNGDPQVKP